MQTTNNPHDPLTEQFGRLPVSPCPPGLNERILARIAQERERRAGRRAWLALAASIALFLIFTGAIGWGLASFAITGPTAGNLSALLGEAFGMLAHSPLWPVAPCIAAASIFYGMLDLHEARKTRRSRL